MGYTSAHLSIIIRHVEQHIFQRASPAFNSFHPTLVTRAELARYSDAITRKGCPIPRVWAFLDGYRFGITRPGGHPSHQVWKELRDSCRHCAQSRGWSCYCAVLVLHALQEALYSGYYGTHCLNYHALTTPDGIIVHMFGPGAGRGTDINTLNDSKLLSMMAERPGTLPQCLSHALSSMILRTRFGSV